MPTRKKQQDVLNLIARTTARRGDSHVTNVVLHTAEGPQFFDRSLATKLASLNMLHDRYTQRDLTTLLDGLAMLRSAEPPVPPWFIDALVRVVLEVMGHRTTGRTGNLLKYFESKLEDRERASTVQLLHEVEGLSLRKAYPRTAAERADVTGVYVNAESIRQSCRRVKQEAGTDLGDVEAILLSIWGVY